MKKMISFYGTAANQLQQLGEFINEHVVGKGVITKAETDIEAGNIKFYVDDVLVALWGNNTAATSGNKEGLWVYANGGTINFYTESSLTFNTLLYGIATDNGFAVVYCPGATSRTNATYSNTYCLVMSTFENGDPFIIASRNVTSYPFNLVDLYNDSTDHILLKKDSYMGGSENSAIINPYFVSFSPVASFTRPIKSDNVAVNPMTFNTKEIVPITILDSSGTEWVNFFGVISLKA